MKTQVAVFWVMTPCNVALGYRRFGGPCCLHFTSLSRLRQQDPSKRWYPTTSLHDVTTHRRVRLEVLS